MVYVIGQLFFGLIIGTLVKLIMPDHYPTGLIGTIMLGLIGSIIGTFVSYEFFGEHPFIGWSMATIGALVVLFIYGLLTGRQHRCQPKSLP